MRRGGHGNWPVSSQTAPQPIAEIRFTEMQRVNPIALRGLMETTEGKPVDQKVLERDMLRLFGTGDFEHVSYRILQEPAGQVVNIDAAEKSWGPDYLRFGLGLGSDLQGDAFFNLAASYRRTWMNSRGAEWRTDLQAGRTSRFVTEWYQPTQAGGPWFVAARAGYERSSTDLFRNSERIARYSIRESEAAVDVGATLGAYAEMRLGYVAGSVHTSLDTGPADLAPPEGRINRGALVARAIVDQLGSANFPTSGYAASLRLFASREALGAASDYTKWDVDALGAWSLRRHTISLAAKGAGALGPDGLPRYDLVQWGGFLQQSGYPIGALLGEHLVFGRLVYTYKLVDQTLFEGLYAGLSLEAGRMNKPLVQGSPTGLLKSTALFFGVDTPLGPLYLGVGKAADGNRSGYLYLGRP